MKKKNIVKQNTIEKLIQNYRNRFLSSKKALEKYTKIVTPTEPEFLKKWESSIRLLEKERINIKKSDTYKYSATTKQDYIDVLEELHLARDIVRLFKKNR